MLSCEYTYLILAMSTYSKHAICSILTYELVVDKCIPKKEVILHYESKYCCATPCF
jgi:hypothetical protein